jgi:hypothetical protein
MMLKKSLKMGMGRILNTQNMNGTLRAIVAREEIFDYLKLDEGCRSSVLQKL